jgi:heme-degrading monooxygenase HmoA
MAMLVVRKLADKTSGRRVPVIDSSTGALKLVNPDTPGEDHEPWPSAGVKVMTDGGPPDKTAVSVKWASMAEFEGWLRLENKRVVHKPGGPPENPWGLTHTFVQADFMTLHTVDGDVRYRVVRNPDKAEDGNVEWFYTLELVGADNG